jgi:hypothetical protein
VPTNSSGGNRSAFLQLVWAQPELLDVFGVELIAGERPEEVFAAFVLVTQHTAESLGVGVGDRLPRGFIVSGIVENFAYSYVGRPLGLTLIGNANASAGRAPTSTPDSDIVALRYAGPDRETLRRSILPLWRELFPGVPLPLVSVAEEVEAAHMEASGREERITGAGALVATLLAALGVFGLAAFEVRRRRHDLAVRAAYGATPAQNGFHLAGKLAPAIACGLIPALPLAAVAVDGYFQSIGWVTLVPISVGAAGLGAAVVLGTTAIAAMLHMISAARLKPALILSQE